MIRILLALLISSILVGCGSSRYAIKYDSQPQGATVVCNGQNLGYTPQVRYYDKKKVMSQTKIDMSECYAKWSSGAMAKYGAFSPSQYPDGVTNTLPRPNVPGYQQDAEFELKVKQMQNQNNQSQQNNQNSNKIRCRRTIGGEVTEFTGSFCPVGYFPAG